MTKQRSRILVTGIFGDPHLRISRSDAQPKDGWVPLHELRCAGGWSGGVRLPDDVPSESSYGHCMIFLGLDPGLSGAIACIYDGRVEFIKNKVPEKELWEWLRDWNHSQAYACIERVHAMPKQGVSSTFKFGHSFGILRGFLIASGIPFDEVTPQKWQTELDCRTGGNKNVTRERAKEWFPQVKVTHANADAILLAEYCRRMRNNGPVQPQKC